MSGMECENLDHIASEALITLRLIMSLISFSSTLEFSPFSFWHSGKIGRHAADQFLWTTMYYTLLLFSFFGCCTSLKLPSPPSQATNQRPNLWRRLSMYYAQHFPTIKRCDLFGQLVRFSQFLTLAFWIFWYSHSRFQFKDFAYSLHSFSLVHSPNIFKCCWRE
jgi:hypothetical protein